VLFLDMLELYRERGDDVGALGTASKRYDEWLVSLRREFRRRRTLPVAWLPERFAAAFADGEIERVLANPRLAAFARHVVCEGAVLDYRSLRLSC
jgi:hypothetical protein